MVDAPVGAVVPLCGVDLRHGRFFAACATTGEGEAEERDLFERK